MTFTLRELLFGVIAAGSLIGAIVQGMYLEITMSQKHEMGLQREKRELEQEKERMQRYYQFKLKEAGVPYKPEDDDPKKKASWNERLPGYSDWCINQRLSSGDIYFGSGNVYTGSNILWGSAVGMVIDYPLGHPIQ